MATIIGGGVFNITKTAIYQITVSVSLGDTGAAGNVITLVLYNGTSVATGTQLLDCSTISQYHETQIIINCIESITIGTRLFVGLRCTTNTCTPAANAGFATASWTMVQLA
jgi:hypothetical protein